MKSAMILSVLLFAIVEASACASMQKLAQVARPRR
jgi:hypothetical protein